LMTKDGGPCPATAHGPPQSVAWESEFLRNIMAWSHCATPKSGQRLLRVCRTAGGSLPDLTLRSILTAKYGPAAQAHGSGAEWLRSLRHEGGYDVPQSAAEDTRVRCRGAFDLRSGPRGGR